MREYVGTTDPIYSVAYVHGDQPRLAALTWREVLIWGLNTADPLERLEFGSTVRVPPILTVSPDGKWLVAGPAESLKAWSLTGSTALEARPFEIPGLLTAKFLDSSDRLTAVFRSTNGESRQLKSAAVPIVLAGPASEASAPTLYSLNSEQQSQISHAPLSHTVSTTSLSDNGDRLAMSLGRKGVFVWNKLGQHVCSIRTRSIPNGVAISPDGTRIAVDGGTTVYLFNSATSDLLVKWKAGYSYGPGLAWSPDCRLLGRVDGSTTARLYDTFSGRETSAMGTKRGINWCISFAPDGLTYATGTYDGRVRIWDLE